MYPSRSEVDMIDENALRVIFAAEAGPLLELIRSMKEQSYWVDFAQNLDLDIRD